jgi:hypothetical protein
MHLTVIHPFGEYARGDKIFDEDKIAEILDGENKSHCVRTTDLADTKNGTPVLVKQSS